MAEEIVVDPEIRIASGTEEFETDQEFRDVLPTPTAEVCALREAWIKQEGGCWDPLVVSNGSLIDRHVDHRICVDNDLRFAFRSISLADREAVMEWKLTAHLCKQFLSVFARSYIRGKLCQIKIQQAEQTNPEVKDSWREFVLKQTVIAKLSQKLGVDTKVIQQDANFTSDLDKVAEAAVDRNDEFRNRWLSGEFEASPKALSALAQKPLADQVTAVESLLTIGKLPRKPRKQTTRPERLLASWQKLEHDDRRAFLQAVCSDNAVAAFVREILDELPKEEVEAAVA